MLGVHQEKATSHMLDRIPNIAQVLSMAGF